MFSWTLLQSNMPGKIYFPGKSLTFRKHPLQFHTNIIERCILTQMLDNTKYETAMEEMGLRKKVRGTWTIDDRPLKRILSRLGLKSSW